MMSTWSVRFHSNRRQSWRSEA